MENQVAEPSQRSQLEVGSAFASNMVSCIHDAVGDTIKEDISHHRLKTQNSTPARIWDHIYTAIGENFITSDYLIGYPTRGPWHMAIVFDTKTGFLYTLMREKRYKELHDQLRKRKTMHYIDLCARCFNSDLHAPINQVSLFESQPKVFEDEGNIKNSMEKLLSDILSNSPNIKHHVLILFESKNFELLKIRAAMVDADLNVVAQNDLIPYISVQESVIMDHVQDPKSPVNNPSGGLKLTEKAIHLKKGNHLHVKQDQSDILSTDPDQHKE